MEEEAAPATRASRSSRPQSSRSAVAAQEEAEPMSQGMLAVTIVTTALMVWGTAFVFAALSARSTALTDSVVDMMAK